MVAVLVSLGLFLTVLMTVGLALLASYVAPLLGFVFLVGGIMLVTVVVGAAAFSN